MTYLLEHTSPGQTVGLSALRANGAGGWFSAKTQRRKGAEFQGGVASVYAWVIGLTRSREGREERRPMYAWWLVFAPSREQRSLDMRVGGQIAPLRLCVSATLRSLSSILASNPRRLRA